MAVTDCSKCGAKMRIETEEVGKDGNGLPIIHRIGYCDSCMSRFDLDVMQNQPKPKEESKKNSSLSVLALIFSLIGLTLPIAFILALIDLCINDKTKKHTGSWFALIFSILCCLVFSINSNKKNGTNENSKKEAIQSSIATPAKITKNKETEDGIIKTESDGCCLKYLRHEIKENSIGEECVVVFYEFTNNSEETTSYIYTFTDQAFQNGIELEKSLFLIDDIDNNHSKDIRPGVSIEVYSLFKPQDKSIIELEVYEWVSLSDKPLDNMELSLE